MKTTFFPIVAREMSVLSRRASTYWARAVTAIFALLVLVWLLIVSTRLSFAQLGSSIFMILSSLCFLFSLLIGMQATSDSVSEEKREGTLGLLFLTDLRPFEIIAGKLAATSLNAALALLGVVPVMALALLLGGVILEQVLWAFLVMANTMFLSLSIGILVSTLSQNERKAMLACFGGLFLISVGPFMLSLGLTGYERFLPKYVWPSPIHALQSIHARPFTPAVLPYFYDSLAVQHFLAWACLLTASYLLPKSINAAPSRRFARLRQWWHEVMYGRVGQRLQHRAKLLDQNAFLWLASREQAKPRYAWVILVFFAGLYAWVAFQFDNMLHDSAVIVAFMFLIHLVFKIWVASEVCSRLIEDRRSGALELLLSSPLSVRDIAQGQHLALRRIFFWPIAAAFVCELFLITNPLQLPGRHGPVAKDFLWFCAAGIGTFLLDLWALKWVGLWLSLTGKSIERVLIASLFRVLVLPWILFLLAMGFLALKRWDFLSDLQPASAVQLWWGISTALALMMGHSARKNFLGQFRELAAARFSGPIPAEATAAADQKGQGRPRSRAPWIFTKGARRAHWAQLVQWARRHPTSAALLGLLVATVAGSSAWRIYQGARLEGQLREIRAQGFPLTEAEVTRYQPPIPKEEDAFAMLGPASPRPIVGSQKTRHWLNQSWRGGRFSLATEEELAEMRGYLQANEKPVENLRRLPSFQRGYVEPSSPMVKLWGGNASFQFHAELMTLAAWLAAEAREEARLEKDLEVLLALAGLLRQQPDSMSQNDCQRVLNPFKALLCSAPIQRLLSEPALARLQARAAALEPMASVVKSLALARASLWQGWTTPHAPTFAPVALSIAARMRADDSDLVAVLDDYAGAMQAVNLPYPARMDWKRAVDGQRMGRVIDAAFGPGLPVDVRPESIFFVDALITADVRLITTALALLRHQRLQQAFPAELQALVPAILPEIPVDPFSGKSLSWKASGTTNGILYSVGTNRQDDQNHDGPKKLHDIVLLLGGE